MARKWVRIVSKFILFAMWTQLNVIIWILIESLDYDVLGDITTLLLLFLSTVLSLVGLIIDDDEKKEVQK